METPGTSKSLLKSKASFHICHTKSTRLPQAPVNMVTHAVLVKDNKPTMVKPWKIAKQTGGTQRPKMTLLQLVITICFYFLPAWPNPGWVDCSPTLTFLPPVCFCACQHTFKKMPPVPDSKQGKDFSTGAGRRMGGGQR